MTLAMGSPKPVFRLGMLLYDTRYRALTIQVVFLVLLSWNSRSSATIPARLPSGQTFSPERTAAAITPLTSWSA